MAMQTFHPPLQQLREQSRRASGRVTVWIAFGLGLVSLIVSVWMLPNLSLYLADAINWLVAGILLLDLVTLLSPALVLVGAMRSTAHLLRSQKRNLLSETSVSNAIPVHDLICVALHRRRTLLGLLIGTMPLFVFGWAHLSLKANLVVFKVVGCFTSYDYEKGCYALAPLPGAVSTYSLLALTALAVGLWGLCLFAAGLGVRLTVWWRQVHPSTLIMPTLLILAATAGIAVLILQAMVDMLPFQWGAVSSRGPAGLNNAGSQALDGSGILPLSILVMLVPYLLSAWIIVTAPRRVSNAEG